VIAANLSRTELRKNRTPELAYLRHPADFLADLAQGLPEPAVERIAWFETLADRERARADEIAAQAGERSDHVNPLDLFRQLDDRLADDSVLVVDGGDFVATASYILRPRRPLSWLDPGPFGTLGVGGGFAMAAALARPSAQVWLIYGDGSSAYSLAEFDSYVRHGVAPIAVVGTDGAWAQIARDQLTLLGDDVGTTLNRTAYHDVAAGYGGVGLLLTDPAEIGSALDRAVEIAASGRPVCLNVHIDRSEFRKGSLSM
jgi:acetolactate synthase-1/2/3 large subunit